MGGAMVGTLRRVGFRVIVWNRDRGKCRAVARASGAEIAESAIEAARAGDIVITSLADDAAVRAVYADALEGFHDGQVVLEMSTIAPETVRTVEPSVRARGATLLDAPVSGSVPVVERGELLIMVGGDAEALDRARPVLEAMSSKIIHAGELGAGATMKLAVNASPGRPPTRSSRRAPPPRRTCCTSGRRSSDRTRRRSRSGWISSARIWI
jgi:3-hydroxyisobutyrate dehydrogenase-like beta-hydroxyacid dehydrogenase